MLETNADADIEILSVSQLNAAARQILEDNFPAIWVEGEISNLATPSSGHLYFTLKDSNAQIRCAFFRGKNRLINFTIENGAQLLVKANVSLYEGRGDYQLIIQQMELAGSGALRRQFELLKAKLAAENLFATEHKKPLPAMPKTIGIITSPTGAAIRDILTTLKRRYPMANIIIYPCQVQGTTAAKQIIEALQTAERRKECEVLVLTRGGGSLEDLWCFNDEMLARQIYQCEIPIVTGIGHEIDFTIADFVADVRAATPTAAAELISPDQSQWLNELSLKKNRLFQLISNAIKLAAIQLQSLNKQLRHPGQIIREQVQTLDFIEQKLINSMMQVLQRYQTQLQHLARTLNTVSPLATLERGYTITREPVTKKIIRSVQEMQLGDNMEIKFVDGYAETKLIKITAEKTS